MKKQVLALLIVLMLLVVTGCVYAADDNDAPQLDSTQSGAAGDQSDAAEELILGEESAEALPESSEESTVSDVLIQTAQPAEREAPESLQQELPQEDGVTNKIILISAGDRTITFQLNDSLAAKGLYDQLPLTLKIENYGSNEKIFYPPEGLDTGGAPLAGGGVGTLAYYAPWGNVVLFYGAYSPNSGLYELGQAVFGGEEIQGLNGTIEISKG